MVEIPDSLRSVFSATVRERDGAHLVEIPSGEIDHVAVTPGERYRVAVLESFPITGRPKQESEHTFNQSRTYGYFCIPHESSGMVGTVRVK